MCEQAGIACSSNAECPEPAACEEGECVYRLVECSKDSECDLGYVCTAIGSGTCSSNPTSSTDQAGPNPGAASDPAANVNPVSSAGQGDESSPGAPEPIAPDADPDAPEPGVPEDAKPAADAPAPGPTEAPTTDDSVDVTCEPDDVKACFPAPVACDDDDACPAGWTCMEVPPGGPESWDDIERSCFPPGLVAVLEDRIKVEGDGIGGSSEDGQAESPVKRDDNENGVPNPPPLPQETSSPNLGTQGGSEGASGCALRGQPASGALPGVGLALMALGLLGRRRRTPAA
jgi:hypothetical protein